MRHVPRRPSADDSRVVARAFGPSWLRLALGALFLLLVWLDAVGSGVSQLLPSPAAFFCQVAQLFPRAADQIIEWHAEGYRCDTRKFEELDVRPYFPIHADDKESTFDRALFFYFKDKRVLRALDHWISDGETARGSRLGGVMLLSVRRPLPEPGHVDACYTRLPLAAEARDERHYWYVTGPDERDRRCGATP
jgi:hypothetical protein